MKIISFCLVLVLCSTAFASSIGQFHRRQGTTINVPPLTSQNAPATYQAQCDAASSATGSQAIANDISNVTSNSLAIQAKFDAILTKLNLIDSENLDPRKFAPSWQDLMQVNFSLLSSLSVGDQVRNQWTDVFWASRTMASNTIAYSNEFTGIIMPFIANQTGTLVPVSTAIEILEEYQSEASDLQDGSQEIATAFHSGKTKKFEMSGELTAKKYTCPNLQECYPSCTFRRLREGRSRSGRILGMIQNPEGSSNVTTKSAQIFVTVTLVGLEVLFVEVTILNRLERAW